MVETELVCQEAGGRNEWGDEIRQQVLTLHVRGLIIGRTKEGRGQ